jgi:2-polyprenyl-3-methyl-5-hydroxy-6-metoxy-1,4-benzoquinol methylase
MGCCHQGETRMIGNPKFNDKNFNPDNYEEFYAHHHFEPIHERFAYDVHEVIPRFGWAYDKVEDLQPKSLLDLGCLDGSFALTIAKHFDIPVSGVDLTEDGIELAKVRAKGLKATFYQGSIEDWLTHLINTGQKFDLVTWFEIIEHVADPLQCVKLIDQVVAPGGSILVSTPDFEAPTYGKDDEENTCHIRLFTTTQDDYEAENKFGHVRKATSLPKLIGNDRIKEISVANELINCLYQ